MSGTDHRLCFPAVVVEKHRILRNERPVETQGGCGIVFISRPAFQMLPVSASQNRISSLSTVLLPDPLGPIKPVIRFSLIAAEKSRRICSLRCG